jgi:hypothetical protein
MLPRHDFASSHVLSLGVVKVFFVFVFVGNIRCNYGLLFHNTHALTTGVNKSWAPCRPGDNFYGPPNTVGSQNVTYYMSHIWRLEFWGGS